MLDVVIIEGYQVLLILYVEVGNIEVMNVLVSDMLVIVQFFDFDIDVLEFQVYIVSVIVNYGVFESVVVMSNFVFIGIVFLMKDDEGNIFEVLEGYFEVLLWIIGFDDYVFFYFKLYMVKIVMCRQVVDIIEFVMFFL